MRSFRSFLKEDPDRLKSKGGWYWHNQATYLFQKLPKTNIFVGVPIAHFDEDTPSHMTFTTHLSTLHTICKTKKVKSALADAEFEGFRFNASWETVYAKLKEIEIPWGMSNAAVRTMFAPTGAIWTDVVDSEANRTWVAVVSFWQKHSEVTPAEVRDILKFFDFPETKWDSILLEFLDSPKGEISLSNDLTTAKDFCSSSGRTSPKIQPLSDLEAAKLLGKAHTIQRHKLPKAEQDRLNQYLSTLDVGSRKALRIATAAGFDNIAEFRAFVNLSENCTEPRSES